ncbi:MAG: ABC transporter ATP-binding protein [Candidatus Asgardarchaeia archaeon]
MSDILLDIQNLKTYFYTTSGVVKAVDDVSFNLKKGEALGLAGESGCGKTTTAYSIMRLVPHPGKIVGGHIYFNGDDLVPKSEEEMRKIRWKKISIIFQGAMNALNPVFTVGDQIIEAILLHEDVSREEAEDRAAKLFEMVGLPPERLFDYPHEFSGGMRQRAMIAMALACNPELVIADEPTTALDVSIQVQILNLLRDLKERLNLSLIVITHDLSIIAELADRVAIMYAGKIVEISDVMTMYRKPTHPYAFALIKSVPDIESAKTKKLYSIPGNPPNLINPPKGCRFHPRCPFAKPICREKEPPLKEIEKGRFVACHFAEELASMEIDEMGKYYEKV